VRSAPAPIPWLPRTLSVVAGLGFVAVIILALSQESGSTLSAPGGVLDVIGRLCGLVGSYLMVIMVVLTARIPWLERSVGQDHLVAWHRRLGGWPIALIGAHIVTITFGYAAVTRSGFLSQLWTFIVHYPDILASLVGFGLLVLAGVSSYRAVRRRIKYESWWAIHLYIYLGLSLAFAHQITTGIMFKGHSFNRVAWTTLWILGALTVVLSRWIRPLVHNARLQLRVDNVKLVAPDVYAVTIKGSGVASMAVSGGQFFQWRFVTPGLMWHSHPYSISAMPRPPLMRITVKALGDQSSAIAHLKRGTRVFVEGPYGVFTKHSLVTNRATLIGAGVGITPLRSLLEDLPKSVKVSVIVRASTHEDLIHADELSAIVASRKGEFHEIVGPRNKVQINALNLRDYVAKVSEGDVYMCGPEGFTRELVVACTALGIASERIHVEDFSFS
jgi:predicted ferric reductase